LGSTDEKAGSGGGKGRSEISEVDPGEAQGKRGLGLGIPETTREPTLGLGGPWFKGEKKSRGQTLLGLKRPQKKKQQRGKEKEEKKGQGEVVPDSKGEEKTCQKRAPFRLTEKGKTVQVPFTWGPLKKGEKEIRLFYGRGGHQKKTKTPKNCGKGDKRKTKKHAKGNSVLLRHTTKMPDRGNRRKRVELVPNRPGEVGQLVLCSQIKKKKRGTEISGGTSGEVGCPSVGRTKQEDKKNRNPEEEQKGRKKKKNGQIVQTLLERGIRKKTGKKPQRGTIPPPRLEKKGGWNFLGRVLGTSTPRGKDWFFLGKTKLLTLPWVKGGGGVQKGNVNVGVESKKSKKNPLKGSSFLIRGENQEKPTLCKG